MNKIGLIFVSGYVFKTTIILHIDEKNVGHCRKRLCSTLLIGYREADMKPSIVIYFISKKSVITNSKHDAIRQPEKQDINRAYNYQTT